MTAKDDLLKGLEPDELIEAIVVGDWGWGGYEEPNPPPVPVEKRNQLLIPNEALEYLANVETLYSGYGAPMTYAMYVWTNKRVMWITQYDGRTSLNSAPRNPVACEPYMSGGG